MKVKFTHTWFGPDSDGAEDMRDHRGRPIVGTARSGTRYKRGVVYDLPDRLRELLPASAEVIEYSTPKTAVKAAPKAVDTSLKDFDHEREVAKRLEEVMNKAGA